MPGTLYLTILVFHSERRSPVPGRWRIPCRQLTVPVGITPRRTVNPPAGIYPPPSRRYTAYEVPVPACCPFADAWLAGSGPGSPLTLSAACPRADTPPCRLTSGCGSTPIPLRRPLVYLAERFQQFCLPADTFADSAVCYGFCPLTRAAQPAPSGNTPPSPCCGSPRDIAFGRDPPWFLTANSALTHAPPRPCRPWLPWTAVLEQPCGLSSVLRWVLTWFRSTLPSCRLPYGRTPPTTHLTFHYLSPRTVPVGLDVCCAFHSGV